MKTWRQMEQLVDMGLVRHIGTSKTWEDLWDVGSRITPP